MLDYRVHELKRVPGTNQAVIVGKNPYVRIKKGDDPALYIQKGRVYSGGGPKVNLDTLPEWFWEEVDKMNVKVLNEVGFEPKAMRAKLAPVEVETEPKVEAKHGHEKKKKTTKKRGRPKRITNGDD